MKKISSIFTFFLLTISISAQVTSKQNEACNAGFSQSLIEQQIIESNTVKETDKRIRIYLRSADFLWKLDEKTARKYFADALKIAYERFAEKGREKKQNSGQGFGMIIYEPDYRLEVIRTIAKKDSVWAKKLTELILAEYEKSIKENGNNLDSERVIVDLLRIAEESVISNPNLSWHIFRRIMKYPLNYYWYFGLYDIAGENRQIADALYTELLQNYANEKPRRLLFLSAYPFARERIFGIDKFSYSTAVPDGFTPNSQFQKQFIQIYLRRINSFASNPEEFNLPTENYNPPESVYIASVLLELEPFVLQNFPELTQTFSETKTRANTLLSDESRKDLDERLKRSEHYGSSFQVRLKIAEDADEEGKLTDRMIIDLIFAAKTEDDYAQTESWIEKIKLDIVRRDSFAYFYFLRAKLAIKENRWDGARKFADKVSDLQHRATLYFELAEKQLADETEAAKAFEVLNNVSEITEKAENSVAKAQVLLGLAKMYERVNHSIALSRLTEAVRVINKLENPDIFSNTIYRQIIIPNEFAFYAAYSTSGYNLETVFEQMGKSDFELTLSNARGLDDKYFRTLAIISILRNCVEKKK